MMQSGTMTKLSTNHTLTIVLTATLFQYLQKDLNLYQNLMLTIHDRQVKAYFLFQAIILRNLEENQ